MYVVVTTKKVQFFSELKEINCDIHQMLRCHYSYWEKGILWQILISFKPMMGKDALLNLILANDR